MRQVSLDVLLHEFAGEDDDESYDARRAVERMGRTNQAAALVLFRNLQLDSSRRGEMNVMAVGPECTYKTVDEVDGLRLGDLPSQRMYPVMWCTFAGPTEMPMRTGQPLRKTGKVGQ
jgi:hypothetical protein